VVSAHACPHLLAAPPLTARDTAMPAADAAPACLPDASIRKPTWPDNGLIAAADLYGAGQCRLGARLEADDEVVDAEPFVRVDRPGQLVGEAGQRSAAGLAGISQLAVHADGPAQHGRVGFVEDFVTEPTRLPWGNRSLLLRDPDGNLVNFFIPCAGRHRKVRSLTTSQPPGRYLRAEAQDPRGPRPPGVTPGGLATVGG
jgi:hypothetical protein